MVLSVEISIKINGIEELESKLAELTPEMHGRIKAAMAEEKEAIVNLAKRFCPVRTGYLRSTIYGMVKGLSLVVGAVAPYAIYQEFGTSRIKPRFFLTRAVNERLHVVVEKISMEIGEVVKEKGEK